MHPDIAHYNAALQPAFQPLCDWLAQEIDQALPDALSKLWHAHPVWFLDGNPVVGYSRQKAGLRLMFWSGQGFDEPALNVLGPKFKDASVVLQGLPDLSQPDLRRWLDKARHIQWDYQHIVQRKGRLERLV